MKVRQITATSSYKHIEFGQLKDDWRGRYVYSPMGFQPILRFEYIKTGPSIQLDLSNGEQLLCDPGHIVATISCPKFSKDLKSDDKLIGYGNQEVTFVSSDGPVVDLYDIEIPSPHWYYTAGIVSHNTLILINSAYAAMKAGHNVMFVTFELSTLKTAMRLAAALAGIELSDFTKPNVGDLPPSELDNLRAKQATVRNRVQKASTTCGSLVIYELPPAECSIDDIYGIIENNKKLHGWVPKVVVLDYLELMLSRHGYNNDRGDYARQQNVAMEMRGLANNENVFVYTATQTNRGAITENQQEHIDVNKIAESFGKAMPVDYVVSLNQTQDEYKRGLEPPKKGEKQAPSVIRLWIAKNRNGPKFVSVTTNVFYGRMQILEIE